MKSVNLQKSHSMFLELNHQKLEVYKVARKFVFECYKMTKTLPDEERFNMISQIRRAALSVHLNIAEGASRKSSAERKRFYEVSRGSVIEIDAALDVASDLDYFQKEKFEELGKQMLSCFRLLSNLINSD
ncbi:MAG TPA: four helix bundle protein [Chitinophagales bacterium]|nr:four helix bundle protein [Chitinophagales bacterium]